MADTEPGSMGDRLGDWRAPLNGLSMIKRPGEMSDDLQSREFINRQSSNSRTVPKGLLPSNGRAASQLKSQVRILHRDAKSPSNISENQNKVSRTVGVQQGSSIHCKSLQQREAEYAQARLRIFGHLPPGDNKNVGSETGGNLAKSTGCRRQKQSKLGVTKPAASLPAYSLATNHPKGTLLRRPTNGASDIVIPLSSS